MPRHIFIFLGTFVLGAVIALAARTATHNPAPTSAIAAPAVAADPHAAHTPVARPADPHAGHSAAATPASKPVNTVCAICGMDVDPKLPTLTYQGKAIGFGCKMCPPKFKAEPDKYGPYYLRNEVIKR